MKIKTLFRHNGLSIVLILLFLLMQLGFSVAGWHQFNDEKIDHGAAKKTYVEYLQSYEFLEATMENWESEFLQMYLFVVLTTHLFQKGSAASKDPDSDNEVDADPRLYADRQDVPMPVRRGGWLLRVYEQSLGLAFLGLFLVSFYLHALGGAHAYSEEQVLHGKPAIGVWDYLGAAQFWFESLQNWQSEFFSLALMVILTVFLRQRSSPESKPVACPHTETA